MRREKEEQEEPCVSWQIYRDLCKASGQKDFTGFILKDLQICCEREPRLISWVVPDIYKTFPKQTIGNVELLQMVLERLDSSQLHDLVCMVLQGSLQMFDNNSFANILGKLSPILNLGGSIIAYFECISQLFSILMLFLRFHFSRDRLQSAINAFLLRFLLCYMYYFTTYYCNTLHFLVTTLRLHLDKIMLIVFYIAAIILVFILRDLR